MIPYIFTASCAVLASTASLPFSSWSFAIIGAAPLWIEKETNKFIKSWFVWHFFFQASLLIWWVPSLSKFFHFSYFISIPSYLIFFLAYSAYISLVPKITVLSLNKFNVSKFPTFITIISLLIVSYGIRCEWGFLFWTDIGISLINSPFSWVYAYVGQYIMTAFVLMLSWCLIYRQKMLVLILLTLGMISISFSHQYTTPNDTITASILQGPLAKNSDSIKIYENLTTKSGSDIIIWPEVTLDGNSYLKESTVLEWNTYLINKNQSLFAGTRFKDNNQNYYNAAIALGKAQGHYFKHFLVPFGEFIPLIQYFPHSLDYFNLRNFGLGGYSFSPHKTNPFNIDSKVLFNSFICYEMAYPRLNKYINRSAQANIVFNNEYWYEGNLQRTHMINFARLMSIQTQKPTLVSSIAGPTVSIDHQGVIIGKLDKHQIGSLETNVELYSGNTPYELYSLDKWFIISMLITFIGMIVYEYKTRRNS